MRILKCPLWLDAAQSAYQVEEQILFKDYFPLSTVNNASLGTGSHLNLVCRHILKQILLTGAVPKTASSSVKLCCSPTHTPSFKMVLTPTAAWMPLL